MLKYLVEDAPILKLREKIFVPGYLSARTRSTIACVHSSKWVGLWKIEIEISYSRTVLVHLTDIKHILSVHLLPIEVSWLVFPGAGILKSPGEPKRINWT